MPSSAPNRCVAFIKSIQPTVPDASLAVEQHREPSDSADGLLHLIAAWDERNCHSVLVTEV